MGSISVTITRAPCPFSDWAQPLPTSPKPQTTATLPPIITSVARLMPSMSECRQPYRLSNLLFVTESLTLIAGKSSRPSRASSYRRMTPVVVSSVTPLMPWPIRVQYCGSRARLSRSTSRMTAYSSESDSAVSGTAPSASKRVPRCTSSVASPPSSRRMFGPTTSPDSSRNSKSRCVAHQYSGRVSPFQANTGSPAGCSGVPSPTTIAAAAWSWVEKMLQLTQRTSAPSASSVSMRTAVCTVMCREPAMRAPASGCASPYSVRSAIRPGISCSASWISLRPKGARERSATLWSPSVRVVPVLAVMSLQESGPAPEPGLAGRMHFAAIPVRDGGAGALQVLLPGLELAAVVPARVVEELVEDDDRPGLQPGPDQRQDG